MSQANLKKVQIKLIKSLIGRKISHVATAKALGLKKINNQVTHILTPSIGGMIKEIDYLLEVKDI